MHENNAIPTVRVGDVALSLLSEGQRGAPVAALTGTTPEILQKYAPDNTYPSAINAFLLRTPKHTILVDTGLGQKLFESLAALGVAPEQVDAVLLTHMHGDHIGGLLRNDAIAFPRAQVYVAKREYNYWTGMPSQNGTRPEAPVQAYGNALHFLPSRESGSEGLELFPGIRAVAAYGHTPGHTVFLVESKGGKILFWGDITHAMALQIPVPAIATQYDVDPREAIATRQKIFAFAAERKALVAGVHIPTPGMGYIASSPEGGYVFTPAV